MGAENGTGAQKTGQVQIDEENDEENGTGPNIGKSESHLIGPVPFSVSRFPSPFSVSQVVERIVHLGVVVVIVGLGQAVADEVERVFVLVAERGAFGVVAGEGLADEPAEAVVFPSDDGLVAFVIGFVDAVAPAVGGEVVVELGEQHVLAFHVEGKVVIVVDEIGQCVHLIGPVPDLSPVPVLSRFPFLSISALTPSIL